MKYIIAVLIFLVASINEVSAGYIEDVKNLGYVAGEGLACGAQRYKAYELVARAYLVSSASSDQEQEKGMNEYNQAKAQAFLSKRHDGLWNCDAINRRFNKQQIFKTKLYKDGRLKMPDGKVIIPRDEYDATLLYDINEDERERLNELYDNIMARKRKQAQKEGIYDKIRKAEAKGI